MHGISVNKMIQSSVIRFINHQTSRQIVLFSSNMPKKTNIFHQMSAGARASSQCMVVGLGNNSMPNTRHSIGMATIDRLCKHLDTNWRRDRECMGDIAIATLDGHLQLILLKPRLLMNINGRSVVKTARKYQVTPANIYLLHDDLDKSFGKFTFKGGGSASGHNGVKSAIEALGTNVMPRLRIGIGRPTHQDAVIDYVLSAFSIQEKEHLPLILDECVSALLDYIIKRKET